MYDMPKKKDLWQDNPYIPGTRDMRKILHPDMYIPGLRHATEQVQSLAAMMPAFEAERLAKWAKNHPTADPRMYVPLAQYGVDPLSPEALEAVNADLVNQVGNGQYGATAGTTAPTPPATSAPAPADENDDDGFWGNLTDAAGSLWSNTSGALFGHESAPISVPGMVKTLWRTELTTLAAPVQAALGGLPRNVGGSMSKSQQLRDIAADKYDLSEDTIAQMETRGRFWEAATFDPTSLPGGTSELERAKAASAWIERRMGKYEEEQPSVFEQTDLGQVVQSYRDDNPANLLTARPEDGSVYDPKSGEWYNPKTKQKANWITEEGILPSPFAAEQSKWEAIKAWDIRTQEEKANGVAPTAWTIGRGVAHNWFSPDETAFSVVSGIVDTAANLFGDPVNLVPVGAGLKFTRGTFAGSKALANAGDDIVVLTRGPMRAGTMAVPSPAAWTREAGQGAKAKALIEDGADVALDPSLAQRGFNIIPMGAGKVPKVGRTLGEVAADAAEGTDNVVEAVINNTTGQIFTPHARYVINKNAWQWLQSGRGARIVDQLAGMTSPTKIIEKSNGNFNVGLATRIAGANTPEEVRAVLGQAMGIDIRRVSEWGALGGRAPALARLPLGGRAISRQFEIAGKELAGGAGIATKRGRSKMAQNYHNFGSLGAVRSLYRGGFRVGPVTAGGFNLDSADDTYREVKAFVDGARMWDDTMYGKVDELLTARNGAERYNLLYGSEDPEFESIVGSIQRRLNEEFGIPENEARRITRVFAGGLDPAERRYANSNLDSTGGFGVKGDGIGDALLLSEMMGSHAVLPDYRTMRRATGVLSKIYKLPDPELVTKYSLDGMNGITSIWRSATLIRGAYVLREIGEMAFAMSLAGADGMFTHPFQFLANATTAAAGLEMKTWPARYMKNVIASPATAGNFVLDKAGRLRVAYGRTDEVLRSLDAHLAEQLDEIEQYGTANLPIPKGDYTLTKALAAVADESEEAVKSGAVKFRDLSRAERIQISKLIDKDALREYLLLQRGFRALYPSFDPRWARVNGLGMFDEANAMTRGETDVYIPPGQRELNITSGYLAVDEPSARGAARYTQSVFRDEPTQRRAYVKAHIITRLQPLAGDQTMRRLADEEQTFDDVFDWWHGSTTQELQHTLRPSLMERNGESLIPTEDSAREYLYGYQRLLGTLTGDDPELLKAVATGQFDGKPISPRNQALVDYISKKMDDEPEFVARLPIENRSVRTDTVGTMGDQFRRFGSWFFGMSGEFGDMFGRAPLLRQAYADRVLEMAPHMTHEAKWHAVANLREAGDIELAKKIAKTKTSKSATLGIDEVEIVAQGYARKEMEKIFYNAHRRQNWALAMRVAAPFAQATMNTFKRWGMFSFQHPQMLYRTLKPIEALTDPDSAVIYEVLGSLFGDENMKSMYTPGRPDLSVDGFFFHNEYGDRMFAYPALGGQLINMIPGVDVPEGMAAASPWQNLNVAGTSFNPGTGPLITFPAAFIGGDEYFKDSPAGDFLRFLAPYGLPQDDNAFMRGVRAFFPSTMNRAFPREDQQANLLLALYQAELNSGQYDVSKESDKRAAMAAAREALPWFNALSSIGGSFVPSTFQWEQFIDTSKGNVPGETKPAVQMLMIQAKLAEEFEKYTEPKSEETRWEDYKAGMYQFYLDYGRSALMSVLPRSASLGDGPVSGITDSVWAFRSDHPDVYNKYRDVIPLFFPGGDPYGDFSEGQRAMYGWERKTGERYVPDLETWDRDVDSQLGWMMYGIKNAELTKRIPDESMRTPYLQDIREDIRDKFPGWNPEERTSDFEGNVNLLREAVEDEDVAALPGSKYIKAYLDARERAIDEVQWGMGGSGDLTTEQAAPVRAQLFTYASSLVRQDPTGTFSYAWVRFLSREFEED